MVKELDSPKLIVGINVEKKEGVTIFGLQGQDLYVTRVDEVAS
jgi:hypothetical protein